CEASRLLPGRRCGPNDDQAPSPYETLLYARPPQGLYAPITIKMRITMNKQGCLFYQRMNKQAAYSTKEGTSRAAYSTKE
ncbi:MAG: hypothetical protein ACPGWR_14350, partial [Ardenticatenaceae bacterium]